MTYLFLETWWLWLMVGGAIGILLTLAPIMVLVRINRWDTVSFFITWIIFSLSMASIIAGVSFFYLEPATNLIMTMPAYSMTVNITFFDTMQALTFDPYQLYVGFVNFFVLVVKELGIVFAGAFMLLALQLIITPFFLVR